MGMTTRTHSQFWWAAWRRSSCVCTHGRRLGGRFAFSLRSSRGGRPGRRPRLSTGV